MISLATLAVAGEGYTFWIGLLDLLKVLPVPIGVAVAWGALSTWRRQLAGTAAFNNATAVLKQLIHLEHEFQNARNPMMTGGEMAAAAKAAGKPLDDQDFISGDEATRKRLSNAQRMAYFERLKRLADKFNELHALSVEAQVLFGDDVREAVQGLKGSLIEFQVALEMKDWDRHEKPDRAVYSTGDDDPLAKAVTAAANKLRDLLTPYVRAGLPKVKRRKPAKPTATGAV